MMPLMTRVLFVRSSGFVIPARNKLCALILSSGGTMGELDAPIQDIRRAGKTFRVCWRHPALIGDDDDYDYPWRRKSHERK